jgi:hypothetical protein
MECPSHPAPGLAGSVLEEGFRVTDGSIRFLAGLSLAALAAITGIVSYLHALTVVYLTGSAGLVAYLIPFVADLMIVTASLAILDAIRHHAPKPPLAMVSLVTGIGSTLAMNIVAGLHISAGGALVAALPPVAFVLSLETLMGIVRLARAGDGGSHRAATDGQCPHQVAMSAEDAVVTAYLHARDCLGEPVSQRQLSATFGVPRPKVAALVGTLNGTRPNDAAEDVVERVSLNHQQPTAGHPLVMPRSASPICERVPLDGLPVSHTVRWPTDRTLLVYRNMLSGDLIGERVVSRERTHVPDGGGKRQYLNQGHAGQHCVERH